MSRARIPSKPLTRTYVKPTKDPIFGERFLARIVDTRSGRESKKIDDVGMDAIEVARQRLFGKK